MPIWHPFDGRCHKSTTSVQETKPIPGGSPYHVVTGDNDDGCLIKGNINNKGERIYHLPGGKWYDRTKISTEKGERWFCSEAEAADAGWRASRE